MFATTMSGPSLGGTVSFDHYGYRVTVRCEASRPIPVELDEIHAN